MGAIRLCYIEGAEMYDAANAYSDDSTSEIAQFIAARKSCTPEFSQETGSHDDGTTIESATA
jgi:cytochrome c553